MGHTQPFHIEPQSAIAFVVLAGGLIRNTSPAAEHAADLTAFAHDDPSEWLSSGRTIDYASNIFVSTGSLLYSNRSNVVFTIVGDTAGRHDFLLSPCSLEMFRKLCGFQGHHPSYFENLATALANFGISPDRIPTTLNLFMNVGVAPITGQIAIGVPSSKAGDDVDRRAETNLIVGVTACSAELSNNGTFKPIDVEVVTQLH
jgi:uncharacterized protein